MTKAKPSTKLVFINLAQQGIGEPMRWQDFEMSMKERGSDLGLRAVWQICMYEIWEARKHEESPDVPTDERHYASGRAFTAGQILQAIYLLIEGRAEELKLGLREELGWEPQDQRKAKAKKQPAQIDAD